MLVRWLHLLFLEFANVDYCQAPSIIYLDALHMFRVANVLQQDDLEEQDDQVLPEQVIEDLYYENAKAEWQPGIPCLNLRQFANLLDDVARELKKKNYFSDLMDSVGVVSLTAYRCVSHSVYLSVFLCISMQVSAYLCKSLYFCVSLRLSL